MAVVTTDILDCSRPIPSPQKPTCQNSSLSLSVKPGQAYPQDAINEFIIRKLNPLVLVMSREFTLEAVSKGNKGNKGNRRTGGKRGTEEQDEQGEQGNKGNKGNKGNRGTIRTGKQGQPGKPGEQGEQEEQGKQGKGQQRSKGSRGTGETRGTRETGEKGKRGKRGTGEQREQGNKGNRETMEQGNRRTWGTRERGSLNVKISEVQLVLLLALCPFIHCLDSFCERQFYALTHVKSTRHWKSTLGLSRYVFKNSCVGD